METEERHWQVEVEVRKRMNTLVKARNEGAARVKALKAVDGAVRTHDAVCMDGGGRNRYAVYVEGPGFVTRRVVESDDEVEAREKALELVGGAVSGEVRDRLRVRGTWGGF